MKQCKNALLLIVINCPMRFGQNTLAHSLLFFLLKWAGDNLKDAWVPPKNNLWAIILKDLSESLSLISNG